MHSHVPESFLKKRAQQQEAAAAAAAARAEAKVVRGCTFRQLFLTDLARPSRSHFPAGQQGQEGRALQAC